MNKYNCKPTCPPIAAPVEVPVLFNRTLIEASRGDETGPEAPYVGKFRNTLVVYEASDATYLFSSDGNFTFLGYGFSQITKEEVERLISEAIGAEAQIREDADEALGLRIDDVENDLDAETSARIESDTTLQNNINAEATARESADEDLSDRITAETNAREAADATLSDALDDETAARAAADSSLQDAITAESTARSNADATLQDNITAEATARGNADTTLQNNIDAIDTAINKSVMTDLVVDPNTSTTVVELDATKTNIKTSTTATTSIPLPVASTTRAGVMNTATYQAVTENTNNINALINGAVAITGLSSDPTQSELTTAWQTATGLTALMNRAGIYDVTNSKVWTYYTNDTTWHYTTGTAQVIINTFTNNSEGTIKGSTNDGQLFAENDGTGSVNGWDTWTSQVATNTSKLATIEQGAQVNVQANWTEADSTADSYIQNKPTIPTKTSDLNNDSNFITGTDVGSQIVPVYINNGVATAAKVNASGANWNIIPQVRGDGVMEVGKFIDFHSTDAGTTDQDARIENVATNVLKIDGNNGDLRIRKDNNTDFSLRTIATTASYIGSTVGQPSSLAYVGSANIQDGAVTTDKIADLNVTEGKLASNSVTTSKIADGSVTSDKIDWTTTKLWSATEHITGSLDDDTIVYCKTETVTTPSAASGSVALSSSGIGTVLDSEVRLLNNGFVVKGPTYAEAGSLTFSATVSNNQVYFSNLAGGFQNKTVYVTRWYIKN